MIVYTVVKGTSTTNSLLLTNQTDSQDLGRLKNWKSQKRKHPEYGPHVVVRTAH